MSIQFSKKAPSDGHERVQKHLSETNAHSTKEGILSLRDRGGLQLSEAIQTWSIPLGEASESPHFGKAVAGEWKYLVFEGEEAISDIHLNATSDGSEVTGTSYGAMTSGLVEALHRAEKLDAVQKMNFEPRLLIIPALPFIGLWLHSNDNAEESIILPIPPSSTALEHFHPIPLKALEKEIAGLAKEIHQQIENAPGESGGSGSGFLTGHSFSLLPSSMMMKALSLTDSSFKASASASQLPQFMQPQKQTNWCWAAVGTSVGLMYQTGNWSQCNTATGCLTGQDCCSNPTPCNVYGYLNVSLTYTKSYASSASGTASMNTIQTQINANNPVCTRVAWNGGGAHFMAITGYNGSNIIIQDSIYGTSTRAYSSYPASYHSGGKWTTTYYCKPN